MKKNKFFNFWIKNIKISFILIFFIIIYGIYSIINIPKESSPKVKLGIIYINTIFEGVNPDEIDKQITEKIEKNIKNISGIKEFLSISKTGLSSIEVFLEKDADSSKVYNELQDVVNNIILPNGSEKPKLKEIKTNNNFIFEALLYGKKENISEFELKQKARELKNILEANKYIEKVELGGYKTLGGGKFLNEDDYDIKVILNKEKIEELGLSIHQIAKAIQNSNKNTNLGKQYIDGFGYNFYIKAKLKNPEDLLKVQISTLKGKIFLGDIAKIKKEYKIIRFMNLSKLDSNEYIYFPLLISKSPEYQIKKASYNIKKEIKNILKTNPNFSKVDILYTKDLSEIIERDFKNLYKSAIITIILVFLVLTIFIGFKESLISIILIPISFLLSFIILYSLGISLNIMTNFSLIIAFGIMIDTVIVIVEAVAENRKKGLDNIDSILKALDEFKSPLISGTITTILASLPMMFFPGIVGKFIYYIPLTIFITISVTLIVTLTISSSLFVIFSPKQKKSKKSRLEKFRLNFLKKLEKNYQRFLNKILSSKKLINFYIFTPIILLILSIFFLSSKIGFTMFPNDDNNIIHIEFISENTISKEKLLEKTKEINKILDKFKEIKFYYSTITDSNIFIYLDLKDKNFREKNNLLKANDLVKTLEKDFKNFATQNNLNYNVIAKNSGLNLSSNIGIKIIAQTPKDFNKLYKIGEDIKNFLKNVGNTKNINFSLSGNNGSFVYSFDKDKLDNLGLKPEDITRELFFYINGLEAGTIKSNLENNKIILYLDGFNKNLTPDKIENLLINTKKGLIRVGDVLSYKLKKSPNTITRKNGKIFAKVTADSINIKESSKIQKQLDYFIDNYKTPSGVYFEKAGELRENRETLDYAFKSFFIAICLIFLVLVFQFKSYSQSLLVLYSVVITILGINIGLYFSGNTYGVPFIIGFIALAGIVVNDAIILVDVLNKDLKNKNFSSLDDYKNVIIKSSLTRFNPIIVTTLTTVLGIFPLLFQNKFWETFSYTVIFGLIVGSFMTLVIVPVIFYKFYRKRFLN